MPVVPFKLWCYYLVYDFLHRRKKRQKMAVEGIAWIQVCTCPFLSVKKEAFSTVPFVIIF